MITHLFFVDDLKTFARSENDAKQMMDIITEFSQDIGMSFGEEKCAFINIVKGKRKIIGKPLILNKVKVQELKEECTYKYLGLDESVKFDSKLNKDAVTKEYCTRLRKIWSSQLNAYNKIVASNTFAVPIVIYSFGILDWTKENIKQLNIKTRKIMNMNNSMNRRSDIERLYISRKEGGRGLRNLEDEYLARIPSFKAHLDIEKDNNKFISKVQNQNSSIKLITTSIYEAYNLNLNDVTPREIATAIKYKIQEQRKEKFLAKPIHGYLIRKRMEVEDVDMKQSYSWLKSNSLTSDVESYICTLQEQELYTNACAVLHERNERKKNEMSAACRLCGKRDETVEHILTACPKLSSNLYLETRHNYVAKFIHEKLLEKYEITSKEPQPLKIVSNDDCEIWWDMKVYLATGVQHNKPDIIVWDKKQKKCFVIDISVPADCNINKKIKEKYDAYYPFISELQRIYKDYSYKIIPIIVGALGLIPKTLEQLLKEIGLIDSQKITMGIQKRALIGSLKIAKTFMKMI